MTTSSPDCVFCKIVRGEIPSHRVFEDASCLGFLDIHPLARGHTLIVPKHHCGKLEELPASLAEALMAVTREMTGRVCAALGAPAATIAINNGRESGQEVPHVHVHVVPRMAGDGGAPLHALFPSRPRISPSELRSLAETIAGAPRR